ncbi:MAG TPA: secretin N-terminal domain-containing protein, partial [Pseudomonadales bacterium]|nr:secretin N-terminal domain-containing protein [Pseudomonadales bacterium]
MDEIIPPGLINFEGVDVTQVLEVYAQLEGRTLLHGGLPQASIVLKTETPLTKAEAIQALQAVLALNGIAVIDVPGGKFVKVVPTDQAGQAGEQFNGAADSSQLPELGSYITRIVHLQYVKPTLMVPVIQPFAKAPNAILPIDDNGIIVLRDNVENVKRMMEMIAAVDIIVPAQYTNAVIPIKYAMVDDIANVLNSLETAGGGTVSFGQATTPSTTGSRNGIVGSGGVGGYGSQGIQGGQQGGQSFGSTFGQSGVNGQGSTSQSPFANRLQNILNRVQSGGAGGGGGTGTGFGMQQPIQILGQTKIIADERSNSLLVYATPQDLETITNIVSKLDVLLAQVLIETVIMEVDLNKQWNYGISVAQNPVQNGNVAGAGAINNGQPFFNFLNSVTTNGWPGNFTQTAPSGLSYFANIGPNWQLALQAAASDSSTHIIQRPRIQTSQAKEAQFFVGQSVPYVTSVYYNSGFNGGPSSSYSQLQVGISLDVTPFINPDGLVVMDINQQINDISGFQTIEGVGQVPTTDNRTFTSEVAVKDKDAIILGGFTDTEMQKSSTGVPILEDIPVLGHLFKAPTSNKTRQELLVLMRPTVLRTPEVAALQSIDEQVKSPGIIAARRDEQEVINQERKREAAE